MAGTLVPYRYHCDLTHEGYHNVVGQVIDCVRLQPDKTSAKPPVW